MASAGPLRGSSCDGSCCAPLITTFARGAAETTPARAVPPPPHELPHLAHEFYASVSVQPLTDNAQTDREPHCAPTRLQH